MKRTAILALMVLVLSLTGCRWFGDFINSNLDNDPPKRRPGTSDERYERELEQWRIDRQVRTMQESENKDYMKQYGYPEYPNVPCPPSDDAD